MPGNALRSGFDGSIPQTDLDIAEALETGLLSLDANVLLNFYRYSPNARQALVDVLQAAGERVWISHQAAKEFWRNRLSAIDGRNQATQQLDAALSKSDASIQSAVDNWAKQTAVPEEVKQHVLNALSDGLERARVLVSTESAGTGVVAYDPSKDQVLEVLTDLLSAHVGEALGASHHSAAVAEAARRTAEFIPPGYRDAEKDEDGHPDGSSGDYLVWLQSMTEAVARELSLVIVTGDEKDDWWWKHRGALLGPRTELVDEFAARSSKRLFMLRPIDLIQHADALDVTVSQDAATDVARASERARWTRGAIQELLRRLDREGKEQADVIRYAASQGGVVDREKIYELAGYEQDRMLRGFTRPVSRITLDLQAEGLLPPDVEPALTPIYSGVTAVQFEIPLDMAEILGYLDEDSSSS